MPCHEAASDEALLSPFSALPFRGLVFQVKEFNEITFSSQDMETIPFGREKEIDIYHNLYI